LREAGMKVFGIGEKKTPSPFIASCNKFIYIEILKKEIKEPSSPKSNSKAAPKKKEDPIVSKHKALVKLISDSINDMAEEDGWVFLGVLGSLILKKQPDFDPRNYGHKKLIDLIKTIKELEVESRQTEKSTGFNFYVRIK
jgi:hypothetical protein